MRVEIVDPITEARWVRVEQRADATLYHSKAWARVLASTYGFRPRYYLALEGREVAGGLPFFEVGNGWCGRRLVSLPFSDLGGPVGEPSAIGVLLAAALTDARRFDWRTVEIRGAVENRRELRLTEVLHNDLYTLRLNRSFSDIVHGFSGSVHWGRKRALRDGLQVERVSSMKALLEFYRLHQITRRKLGVPVQPWRFFHRLWEEFASGDAGFIVQTRSQGRVTASSLFLRHGSRLYYKFSASDPLGLASQPNSLVLWKAIEWAHTAGMDELDLGKTVHENSGLARFKRSWGAVPAALPHYYFPRVSGLGAESERSLRVRVVRAVWQRLPLPVTRLVGGLVYRALA